MNKLFIVFISAILIVSSFSQTDDRTCAFHNTTSTANCIRCQTSDLSVCTFCYLGYGIDSASGDCVKCKDSNCLACTGSDTCAFCNYGYGIINGACEKCNVAGGNCDTCNGDVTQCSDCSTGYGLTGSYTCSKCTNANKNCDVCDTTQSTCTACNSGYGVVSDDCVACDIKNCDDCSNDKTSCVTCADGYLLDTSGATPKCNKCPSDCSECTSTTVCKYCEGQDDLLTLDGKTCSFGFKTSANLALLAAAAFLCFML